MSMRDGVLQVQNSRPLLQHVIDCRALYDDFRGLIADWQLKASGVNVRYAVDFSEIRSHVLPEPDPWDFKIFSDDTAQLTVAVQHYALSKLFYGLDTKLVLLPSYAVELRSFAEYLPTRGARTTLRRVAEAQRETRDLVQDQRFVRVEALVARMRANAAEVNAQELQETLEFFQENAANLLSLLDGSDPEPIRRLANLLQQARLEPLPSVTSAELALDEGLVADWESRLQNTRKLRSDSNRLDALAAVTVAMVNRNLRESGEPLCIRLVTRSRHMRQIERELSGSRSADLAPVGFVRHPRAFIALRRAEGQSAAAVLDRLKIMQTTLELVIDAYGPIDAFRPHARSTPVRQSTMDPAGYTTITSLLGEIRDNLHGGANLASVAAVSRNDLSGQATGDATRARILRLFETVKQEGRLLTHLEEEIAQFADSIDRSQQLLAAALQGQSTSLQGEPLVLGSDGGGTAIVKSRLYWMPDTLEFENDVLRDWSGRFETQAETTFGEILEFFRSGFARGLDYEVALSLAYLLGAWDQWALALKYCDIALLEQRLRPGKSTPREGLFFKCVCLRMLFARSADHYDEALKLVDDAQQLWLTEHDKHNPRYVKEKATLLFFWSRVHRRNTLVEPTPEWRSATAMQLCQQALELATDDAALRAQIYNNLCFYYTDTDPARYQVEIAENLNALEAELRPTPIEQWPINYVDTALLAHSRLHTERLDLMRFLRLLRTLDSALRSGMIRARDIDDVTSHFIEAREVLPPGVEDRAPRRS